MSTLQQRLNEAFEEWISRTGRKPHGAKTDLWKPSGASSGAFTGWFNGGTKSMKPEYAEVIAPILGVNARWLYLGKGPKYPDTKEHKWASEPTTKQIVTAPEAQPRMGQYSHDGIVPITAHPPPIMSGEEVMAERAKGKITEPFTWVAEDNHMASHRTMPVLRGYHVHIEPRAKIKPELVVLVVMGEGWPVLKRITHGGDAMYLVVESGELRPVEYDPSAHEILGVMRAAYPQPLDLEMEDDAPEPV